MDIAVPKGMKNTIRFTILLLLLLPVGTHAEDGKPDFQFSDCIVDSVKFEGIDEGEINQDLRTEARSLAGKKYDKKTVDNLADKLRNDLLFRYEISVRKILIDDQAPIHVKIVFRADKPQQKPEASFNASFNREKNHSPE